MKEINKCPIVVDACTVINLLRIDDDNDFLYKQLKTLDVHFAKEVKDEIQRNIFKNVLDDDRKAAIDKLLPLFYSDFTLHQNKDIERDLGSDIISNIKSVINHGKDNNGEFYSALLSLLLSRSKVDKIIFYTDDYPARDKLSSLFSFQQIGTIDDTVDLLLTLCWQSESFSESRLKENLKDLKAEYLRGLRDFLKALRDADKYLDRKDKKRKRIEEIKRVFEETNGDFSKIDLMIKQLGIPNVSKKYKAVSIYGSGNDIKIVRKIDATLDKLGKMNLYKVRCFERVKH